MSDIMIILLDEELFQSSGKFVVTLGMDIITAGDTQLHSMGTQFV